ncbi:radical SAM/SPASM domain-containing protein [Sporomusa sp. KB1]|uniref:radical SAM/SPASM domain-containing protein n=1 Tax=Sporomusa sp. KB1 TaxID=943346 RepID=UPI001C94855B|nr:radical SAM protein [Sporomusa sp. KB1]
MLILSLTGQCNFACKYCYAHEHPAESMNAATAIAAVELAAAAGQAFVVQFSGGEPLLNFPVMQEVIRYVRENGLPAIIQLQTNASLMTKERAAALKAGQVGIGISLDGRPDSNDRQRCLPDGKGTCWQILNGAGQLAAQGIAAGITAVVTNENAAKLSGIVEMAYYLGNIRRIGFDLLRAQGRGGEMAAPSSEAVWQGVKEALQTAERLARQTGKSMLFSQVERVAALANSQMQGFAHCHAMNGEAAFVDAQGSLYACASLAGNPDFSLGHVTTGLDTVKQRKVAALIQDGMSFCMKCPSFSLCGGACFARWYGANCGKQGYAAECALKQVAIEWYLEHQGQGRIGYESCVTACRC